MACGSWARSASHAATVSTGRGTYQYEPTGVCCFTASMPSMRTVSLPAAFWNRSHAADCKNEVDVAMR